MPDTWRSIRDRKQAEQKSRIPHAWLLPSSSSSQTKNVLDIPRQCGVLTKQEVSITEDYDASGLLVELAQGRLKSKVVVQAFCKRATIAHQSTNCLTEILFQDALTRADQLDESLARSGKPTGPLHGLPISLKDTFKIRGYDSSVGIASLCFKPASTNSALVDQLLSLGAVLYCKTNVPQTMMALDSHNNIFGRTLNPANHDLTAGGSSGGEGALVAMRGSILGVGTDVGGSIRVPAACNYIYGVKPSHGRVPYAGQEGGSQPGSSKIAIESTAGPLATSLRDCETFLQAISNGSPAMLDPDVISQPWSQQTPLTNSAQEPLRVGILRTDGHVQPLPPIANLIDEVAQTLRSQSGTARRIEIIDIDATSILTRIVKTFNGIISINGGNNWFDLLEHTSEPLSPWLQGRLTRRAQKTVNDVLSLQGQKLELQTEFLSVWRESGGHWLSSTASDRSHHQNSSSSDRTLDVIICPAAPHPIPPIDRWNSVNYTSAFNLLDLPAGIIPVRKFTEKDLEGETPGDKPLNGWDKINRELWTKVDRRVYLDSPLSVQVLAPRLMERKLVEAMAVIDGALGSLRHGESRKGSKL